MANRLGGMRMVRKSSEGNYKDGKDDGKLTWWYENGQKSSEGNYKDGKRDGKWTGGIENGQIESEKNYKDGKEDGKWTDVVSENGQITSEKNYKDGKRVANGLVGECEKGSYKLMHNAQYYVA